MSLFSKRPRVIPLVPLPVEPALRISKPLRGLASKFEKSFSYLKNDLREAKLAFDSNEFLSLALFSAIVYSTLVFAFMFGVILVYLQQPFLPPTTAKNLTPLTGFLTSLAVALLIFLMVFIRITFYPKIIIKRQSRNLEQNLVHALRAMLVHIRSGVPLFSAFQRVAEGDYGQVSNEFKEATHRINTGEKEDVALKDVALSSSSSFFRKILWQLLNGIKAGADVSRVMGEMVSVLTKEQKIQIQKFGSSLRMLSLIYMMLGVIIPTLGVTFLIVLSSFAKINIGETTFWGLLGLLVIAQFLFLGLLKSQRPSLVTG